MEILNFTPCKQKNQAMIWKNKAREVNIFLGYFRGATSHNSVKFKQTEMSYR